MISSADKRLINHMVRAVPWVISTFSALCLNALRQTRKRVDPQFPPWVICIAAKSSASCAPFGNLHQLSQVKDATRVSAKFRSLGFPSIHPLLDAKRFNFHRADSLLRPMTSALPARPLYVPYFCCLRKYQGTATETLALDQLALPIRHKKIPRQKPAEVNMSGSITPCKGW
jgi:hypothetical protein